MRRIGIAVCVVALVGAAVGSVEGKMSYKKDLGLSACTDCHADGAEKKAANPGNKLWKAAHEMSKDMAAGTGDFAGKTSCASCHGGKLRPAKTASPAKKAAETPKATEPSSDSSQPAKPAVAPKSKAKGKTKAAPQKKATAKKPTANKATANKKTKKAAEK